mmetsp:Transcript_26081/g.65175  ORF Transcript_26081/g.65175 Transcript_26081/m.65175 type:complete len:261 (-) Transcript_26081:162-944(-)
MRPPLHLHIPRRSGHHRDLPTLPQNVNKTVPGAPRRRDDIRALPPRGIRTARDQLFHGSARQRHHARLYSSPRNQESRSARATWLTHERARNVPHIGSRRRRPRRNHLDAFPRRRAPQPDVPVASRRHNGRLGHHHRARPHTRRGLRLRRLGTRRPRGPRPGQPAEVVHARGVPHALAQRLPAVHAQQHHHPLRGPARDLRRVRRERHARGRLPDPEPPQHAPRRDAPHHDLPRGAPPRRRQQLARLGERQRHRRGVQHH